MASKIECCAIESPIDWEKETAIGANSLDNSPSTTAQSQSSKIKDGIAVLLTGATGNLGGAILGHLVANPLISTIHCVATRPSNTSEPRTIPISSPKIIIHYGDLTTPNLGLSTSEFSNLAATVDTIIHSGAQRAFWEYYHVLKAANFGSTKELVRLAKSRAIPIHFLSSGGVLGLALSKEISVAKYPPPNDGSNGYVASKWASEMYLETAAKELGVPVFIYRTLAAANPVTKELPKEVVDEFLRVAKLINKLPSRDDWAGEFDLLPLQEVAGAISKSAVAKSDGKGDVKYVHYKANVKVGAKEIAESVEEVLVGDPDVRNVLKNAEKMPAIEWVGQAKKAGFSYLFAAQDVVFETGVEESGERLVSRR